MSVLVSTVPAGADLMTLHILAAVGDENTLEGSDDYPLIDGSSGRGRVIWGHKPLTNFLLNKSCNVHKNKGQLLLLIASFI